MEILYVIAIVAVFVLCLALLSTARRILRSSPLSSGQLSLSRSHDVEQPEEESLEDIRAEERSIPESDAEYVGSRLVTANLTMAETALPIAVPATTIVAEPIPAIGPSMAFPMEEKPANQNVCARPHTNNAAGIRKPSRRAYNYALECLLLGVTAWVLIKTQQSTSRYSSRRSSRDRVA
jgi:hypothetical protein